MRVPITVTLTGSPVGVIVWHIASDLWEGVTYDSIFLAREGKVFRSCSEPSDHVLVMAKFRWDEDSKEFDMGWCSECRAVVTRPYDGYVYHRYGCVMGKLCGCDEA